MGYRYFLGNRRAETAHFWEAATVRWCQHAADHAANIGSKPWRYLLVPHDEILESRQLKDYLRFKVLSG